MYGIVVFNPFAAPVSLRLLPFRSDSLSFACGYLYSLTYVSSTVGLSDCHYNLIRL